MKQFLYISVMGGSSYWESHTLFPHLTLIMGILMGTPPKIWDAMEGFRPIQDGNSGTGTAQPSVRQTDSIRTCMLDHKTTREVVV